MRLDIARRRERQRDCESCYHTRKRRILRKRHPLAKPTSRTKTCLEPRNVDESSGFSSMGGGGGGGVRCQTFFFNIFNTAILSTGGVLLYLPHHLDLASEDSVGHSTCMSVLARRRAIMGSIVQPKRSCLGLSRCCHVLVTVHAGASQGYVLGSPLYPTGRSST